MKLDYVINFWTLSVNCLQSYDPLRIWHFKCVKIFFWPYQSIWHSQSWLALENYGKVWLSSEVYSNGVAISWWHMFARVQNDGEFSKPIPVTNGIKQSCVLAPTLFSMMFSAMLTDAFQDCGHGFPIRYRFDGKLFNLKRWQAESKVQTDVLDELLDVDDTVNSL